ncbi:sulfite exporter TauE/SafE family protein [Flavisolibacter ginsenosidimutans]|uniref:Probable membrane transporter protein n=2 Tax=Flavisolibacter ginsenosidimutans TaxID=661481 RepID=A0A5B8UP55_9BACT|nr:sulfite exporter TauE/SafE family protein [Flavisolibacter ginsenosidimutans]
MSGQIVLLLLLIGLAAGILSGLVGVGGGIIIVPALMFFVGFSQKEAQGTSLGLLLLPIGILAVINYYNQKLIDVKVVGMMALGFLVGGYLGSKLALVISENALKKIFAVVLFYTAFKMLGFDLVAFVANGIKKIF